MRKGVVHERINSEAKNGDVFTFIGSSHRFIKLLHTEYGDIVVWVKCLKTGDFKLPEYNLESNSYLMELCDLAMIVEGIQENPK